jgi:hypothetical protein
MLSWSQDPLLLPPDGGWDWQTAGGQRGARLHLRATPSQHDPVRYSHPMSIKNQVLVRFEDNRIGRDFMFGLAIKGSRAQNLAVNQLSPHE